MHRRVALCVIASLWFGSASGRAQAKRSVSAAKQVQRDVERIVLGLYRGDVDEVMSYTHPAVLEGLGGTEAAKRALMDAAAQLQARGMKVESLTFPQPPEFFDGGGRRFVYVPTLTIISAGGRRVESLNFQLGVLERNAPGWKYLEGSRMTSQLVQKLFPGYPAERPFPPFYRKLLDPPQPE